MWERGQQRLRERGTSYRSSGRTVAIEFLRSELLQMRYVRYFIWFLILLIGIIFTVLNARSVEIDYYFGGAKTNIFLPLLILIIFVIGVLFGYLAAIFRKSRARTKQ